jgi:hypothetical protein
MTQEQWDRKMKPSPAGDWVLQEEEHKYQAGRAVFADECMGEFANVDLAFYKHASGGRTDLILMIIANHLNDLNETLQEISSKLK